MEKRKKRRMHLLELLTGEPFVPFLQVIAMWGPDLRKPEMGV